MPNSCFPVCSCFLLSPSRCSTSPCRTDCHVPSRSEVLLIPMTDEREMCGRIVRERPEDRVLDVAGIPEATFHCRRRNPPRNDARLDPARRQRNKAPAADQLNSAYTRHLRLQRGTRLDEEPGPVRCEGNWAELRAARHRYGGLHRGRSRHPQDVETRPEHGQDHRREPRPPSADYL